MVIFFEQFWPLSGTFSSLLGLGVVMGGDHHRKDFLTDLQNQWYMDI